MRYLKQDQIKDILFNEVFSDRFSLLEKVSEKIESIKKSLIEGTIDADDEKDLTYLIKDTIEKLESLAEEIEEIDIHEDDIIYAIEHKAICNEISDNLEVKRLMGTLT